MRTHTIIVLTATIVMLFSLAGGQNFVQAAGVGGGSQRTSQIGERAELFRKRLSELREAIGIHKRHRRSLRSDGVVGTGLSLCDGKPCIKVYVTHRTPELQNTLDQILSDQLYIIEESGAIHALPTDE